MPSTCIFEFDRPDPVYYSGETINGRIQLHTTSDKATRSVYILFQGEGKVRWEESRSRQSDGKTHHYTEYYRATENYLHTQTTVLGEATLPAGTHTYTFCIPLPLACPTSCVEKYGQISYELSLVIDRPYRFDNVFNQQLTVIKQFNLNFSPEYLIPVKAEDIKYFCCWPCSSGPVISTLTIPFSGYAPGQEVKYTLEIHNEAMTHDLEGYQMKLKQIYSFTAHTPHHKTRTHSNTLAEIIKRERILRLTKRIFEGTLTIPPVPPSSEHGYIISVRYDIKLEIDTGACHSDSELIVPITIGTVPLAQSATDPSHVIMLEPSAPTPDTPGADLPPSYDICKPPSFEEATTIGEHFIDTDVDKRNRIEGFIPKYPMYTNFALPTAPSAAEAVVEAPQTPLLATQTDAAPSGSQPVNASELPYPVTDVMLSQPPTTGANDGYGWRH